MTADTDTLCKLAEAATHDIVNRLNRVADERRTASCHDEKIAMFVVARISRDDAKLMDEAAAEITTLRAKVKAQAEALQSMVDVTDGLPRSYMSFNDIASIKEAKELLRRAAQEAGNAV